MSSRIKRRDSENMKTKRERKEQRILMASLVMGLVFVLMEMGYALYSHSQSTLMDALYDASESFFIILTIFITPLFYEPISEKRPYGFYQVESFFVIAKSIMMLSVSFSMLTSVIEKMMAGGSDVNKIQVSMFQLVLGLASLLVYGYLKWMGNKMDAPTIKAELMGWKMDVYYSFGMSVAFLLASLLKHTPLGFISPYFDQIMTLLVMLLMLPEMFKLMMDTIRDIFLFSPEERIVEEIKRISDALLKDFPFEATFYDIARTGRHLWVSIYYRSEQECVSIQAVKEATELLNSSLKKTFPELSCELILDVD